MSEFYCVCQSKNGRTGLCDVIPKYQEELSIYKKALELMADELSAKNKCAFQKCSNCYVNEECHNKNWIMDFYWEKAKGELYKEKLKKGGTEE